jgi:hypothetical protein
MEANKELIRQQNNRAHDEKVNKIATALEELASLPNTTLHIVKNNDDFEIKFIPINKGIDKVETEQPRKRYSPTPSDISQEKCRVIRSNTLNGIYCITCTALSVSIAFTPIPALCCSALKSAAAQKVACSLIAEVLSCVACLGGNVTTRGCSKSMC